VEFIDFPPTCIDWGDGQYAIGGNWLLPWICW